MQSMESPFNAAKRFRQSVLYAAPRFVLKAGSSRFVSFSTSLPLSLFLS